MNPYLSIVLGISASVLLCAALWLIRRYLCRIRQGAPVVRQATALLLNQHNDVACISVHVPRPAACAYDVVLPGLLYSLSSLWESKICCYVCSD